MTTEKEKLKILSHADKIIELADSLEASNVNIKTTKLEVSVNELKAMATVIVEQGSENLDLKMLLIENGINYDLSKE